MTSSSHRIAVRAIAVVVVAVSALVVQAPPSTAEPPDEYGWWGMYQQAPGGSNLPAPPGVPEDGLFVSGSNEAVAGQTPAVLAIAALRVTIADDSPARITLKVAEGSTAKGAVLVACPTTSGWDPFVNGRWEARPTYDCVSGLEGTVAETGDTVVFDLPPTIQKEPGLLDVAIVPRGPARVAFQRPDDASIEADFDLFDEEEVATDPSSDPFTGDPTFDPAGDFATDGSFGFDPAFEAPLDGGLDIGGGGDLLSAPLGRGQQALPRYRGIRAASIADPRGDRILAIAVLLALGGGLWWLGGEPTRGPRRLGSLALGHGGAGAAVATVGTVQMKGVGRFARPSSETARPHRL